jgi:hypothetical protein
LPFRVEQVDSGTQVAALASWEEVEAWHERTVISAGWRMVNALPDLGEVGSTPEDGGSRPFAAPESSSP